MPARQSHLERVRKFWDAITVDPGGCMTWRGRYDKDGMPSAYALDRGGPWRAPRVITWEAMNGKIPGRRHLRALCGNRSCVNPRHHEVAIKPPPQKVYDRKRELEPKIECRYCGRMTPNVSRRICRICWPALRNHMCEGGDLEGRLRNVYRARKRRKQA